MIEHPAIAARGVTRALAACLVSLAAACAPESRGSAPPAPPVSSAYTVEDTVWAVVLDSLYAGPATRQVVVRDITSRIPPEEAESEFVGMFDRIPGIRRETLDDYRLRNAEPRAVGALPLVRVPVVRVDSATLADLPDGIDTTFQAGEEPMRFWRAFHVRFPGSSGLITLGRVGFDAARTQAMVNVDRGCGDLCGDGRIILLSRDAAGRWRVVHEEGTWVS